MRLDSDVRIQGMTMALAVGSASLVAYGGSRRNPTAIEQKQIEQAAREILTSEGVPTKSLNGDRMFVRRVFYENDKYEVYKNRDGRWIKEFESEVFGCL